ncbi:uncharacterized protein LOC107274178 [Cephus cinctus]|uniref:Uncharacterized protein LOC107274178 n=1 Tax=Cephus cinctus TaxID=211228 RepID=A0AAJ7CE23_CEPCN|nr:uncharacterized protein LOC107274178 [Cephus cinctus]XP_024947186.1 uncharacterized protein LOC107274178 [Cephus cinctus]
MGRRKQHGEKSRVVEDKNSASMKIINQSALGIRSLSSLPIDVMSRISYPFVKSFEKYGTINDVQEDTIEFDYQPRFVFSCNSCLCCMKSCSDGIVCQFCQMVVYCTEKHKKENLKKHEEICKIFTEVCIKNGGLSLAENTRGDDYRILRVKLIEKIQNSARRPLSLWEKEIILYPRVCAKCHRFGNDLKPCSHCEMVLHCAGHENEHLKWCPEYRLYQKILSMQYKHGNVNPDIPNVICEDSKILPNNFDSFIFEIYSSSLYYRIMDCYTYATLSHVSTVPLTSLYAFQKSRANWSTNDSCTIHVVGAEFQFEGLNLHVWEKLFMHLQPNLKSLHIVLTGPELYVPDVPLDLLGKVPLCSRCRKSSRKIKVSYVSRKLYHEYCRTSDDYVKPDLICLFNPGLYRLTGYNGTDTWPETIREACNSTAPIVVTAYTEHEIPRDIERIQSICDMSFILKPQRNPYASLKPDRNFVSDDTVPLIYKNYYISIVKKCL